VSGIHDDLDRNKFSETARPVAWRTALDIRQVMVEYPSFLVLSSFPPIGAQMNTSRGNGVNYPYR
jgi:hypothetical protein